jgi:hypothetical protein
MNLMTKSISITFGSLFIFPFVLMVYSLTPLIGRMKAIQIVGKLLSNYAAFGLNLFLPKIKSSEEYFIFQRKIKENYLYLGKLYDLQVRSETLDTIEFRVNYCPIAILLKRFGMPELRKYSCAGDWILAQKNKNYWTFKRDHTIGTGGNFCNHTYCRFVKEF